MELSASDRIAVISASTTLETSMPSYSDGMLIASSPDWANWSSSS
jgi:hypothetical protein